MPKAHFEVLLNSLMPLLDVSAETSVGYTKPSMRICKHEMHAAALILQKTVSSFFTNLETITINKHGVEVDFVSLQNLAFDYMYAKMACARGNSTQAEVDKVKKHLTEEFYSIMEGLWRL